MNGIKRLLKRKKLSIPVILVVVVAMAISWYTSRGQENAQGVSLDNIPAFSDKAYVVIATKAGIFKSTLEQPG